ncbi:hypothetical protein [Fontibacter flavus]|uniref:ABC transporter ATPase n=1 Tax=Fontibacter flavus TaxID=654838 RepID=A0ABV6FVK7_9BACT
MYIAFDQMPGHSRIWVYQSDRKFTPEEKAAISERLKAFCDQWNTHGSLMPTSFDIRFDQVIILAVDESQLGASGCSIDSSVRTLRELEQQFAINLLDQGKVSFLLKEDALEVSNLMGVKSKVSDGILQAETIVLNPVVQRKSDLSDKWLIPAKDSWMNKFFMN